jgi:hydrogenase expression/formation protein HypC
MCLGVLAKVVDVEGIIARVSIGGAVVEVLNSVEEVKPGDVVIVHAGTIIQRVGLEDVIENLYAVYEMQKTHYLLNNYSEEEASKLALEDIKRFASDLGLDPADVERRIASMSSEDWSKTF